MGDASAPAPSLPLSDAAMRQVLRYSTLLVRSLFILGFAVFGIKSENDFGFKNNQEFSTIGMAAFDALIIVFLILFLDHRQPRPHNFYNTLKFIGSFSAFLAPFSLLMVALVPPRFNGIGYLFVCVMFAMIVTCFYLELKSKLESNNQQDTRSANHQLQGPKSAIHKSFLVNVPAFIFGCTLFIPARRFNGIACQFIYTLLGMEIAYHFIAYVIFICEKTGKRETRSLIKRDDYDDLNSYLMQLGS